MIEKTLVIVEGEDACKLLDCFVTYKKIVGANQPETPVEADNLTVGAIENSEEQTVELETKNGF